MQDELYTVYHMSIEPSKFPTFKALVEQIVKATSAEDDTLTYQYLVNADHTAVHIMERYRMRGVLPHVEQTFSPFAETFLSLVKIESLYVYGQPTAEIRAKLDEFGAVYLTPFDGFSR
jgi:quinol monooxygenase YgiN